VVETKMTAPVTYLVNRCIAALSLLIILGGVRYAYGREQLRHTNLNSFYQQINSEYFDGKLQNAPVRWGDLNHDEAMGMTNFYDDGSASIVIDKNSNTTEKHTREVISHEACHIWTSQTDPDPDPHGQQWQDCMHRFKGEPK
jgi:predicted SprT family Zn-dependent metalloprotease